VQQAFFHGVWIAIMLDSEAPMNVQLPVRMDKTAFLDWVQGREERYELDRERVIMMTGGSRAHWQITANLFKALDARNRRNICVCKVLPPIACSPKTPSRRGSGLAEPAGSRRDLRCLRVKVPSFESKRWHSICR
jgi:Putative restriction endonuclease